MKRGCEIRKILFNPSYREANRTRARYRLLWGGAGSGKSCNAAADYIMKLSDERYSGANLLVVRRSQTAIRDSAFSELCGAIRRIFGDGWEKYWRVREEPMMMESLVTGGRIIFRGMNDGIQREKVKSISVGKGKLCWIWCEEATELSAADFDLLDDRLRGALPEGLYYQITLTFNPISANHWIKKRFFTAAPDDDVFLCHTTYEDNRFIDDGYRRRMERRRENDPDGYRVYALGEWGDGGSGLILTGWRADRLSEDRARYDSVWCAQDFGFNHADCILYCGTRDGELCVIREIYEKGLDTAELMRLAEAAGFPKDVPMWCDSAEPDRIKTWRREGWRAMPVKKEPGSVAAQIDYLKSIPIVIDESCGGTLGEISRWSWLRDSVSGELTDIPAPGEDDAMAALRYSVEGLRRSARGGGIKLTAEMLGV